MTHVTFKNCYGMEEYLTKLRTKLRIVLGKLRTNNNRLPVIAGRYQNVPREERLCNKCEAGVVVGDKYHVVSELNTTSGN